MAQAEATRSYRMTERAEAMAATRQAILDAAVEIADPRAPLAVIAERAGVSERTVLRHFGDRGGLFAAAMKEGAERVERERFVVSPGDLEGAVANLVAHYESSGDGVIARLAEEGSDERIDAVLETGRTMHRRWVAEKLGPLLGTALDRPTHRRRLAELVAVCDVYTWKLLRRDGGLGREQTETAIVEMVRGISEGGSQR